MQKPDPARWEGVWFAATLAGLAAVLTLPSIRGMDGAGNYVYLLSILNDGDLDFSNEYAAFDLQGRNEFSFAEQCPRDARTGLPANRYGIGSALFWAPAALTAHASLRAVAPDLASGLTRPYEWAVALSSAFWGGLGIWLLYMRLRESFGRVVCLATIGGIVFATPLGFYVWAHGSMSHAVSFFVAVMAALALERALRRPTRLVPVELGLWAGLLAITRIQDATWSAALGTALFGFWGSPLWPRRRGAKAPEDELPEPSRPPYNRFVAAALFAAASGLALLPQLAVWRILYGSWLSGPAPYLSREAGGFEWIPIHLGEVFFGARRGVFLWHPILLIGVAGLLLAARRDAKDAGEGAARSPRGFVLAALAGLALQIYLVSCWSVWWAGASFGNRFFISAYPYLAMGLAHALDFSERRVARWAGPTAIAALMIWNAGLLVQYGAGMISREEENDWGEIVVNQFTEVPAWLIDRFAGRF